MLSVFLDFLSSFTSYFISFIVLVVTLGCNGSPVVGSITTSSFDCCSPCASSWPYSKSTSSSFSACNKSSSVATVISLPSSCAFLCLSTISSLSDIDFCFLLR
nr:MAG TPA: hypothetical protein [Caudoviricetes sp.]